MPDDLSDEVPAVRADGRPGGEYRQLGAGVGLLVEVLLEGEECHYGAEEPADHLPGPVHKHVDGRRVDAFGEVHSTDQEPEGHGRVEVTAGHTSTEDDQNGSDENFRHKGVANKTHGLTPFVCRHCHVVPGGAVQTC